MTLVLLHDTHPAQAVPRVPEGDARYEDSLRDLLFDAPEMLPVRELEPGMGALAPVAKELYVAPDCRLDCLLIDTFGRLVVVECKLWRNPEARRKVVAQILDYARVIARLSYEELQAKVSANTGRPGNVLYEQAKAAGSEIGEAAFVDRVTRDLAAGRFLLLIVGDGITQGTQQIIEYLQDQPGLAFSFGLVEMAEYRFHDPLVGHERTILHPRLLARTVTLDRIVIRNEAPGTLVSYDTPAAAPAGATAPNPATSELAQQWRAFAERLKAMAFDDPGQPPPRNGGMGWMRVPLPGPAHLTLWRSVPQRVVGTFLKFSGAEGLAAYELLLAEREAIDAEFIDAGLAAPEWKQSSADSMISLEQLAPAPWDAEAETTQAAWLTKAANRFVNSLRPRLLQLA